MGTNGKPYERFVGRPRLADSQRPANHKHVQHTPVCTCLVASPLGPQAGLLSTSDLPNQSGKLQGSQVAQSLFHSLHPPRKTFCPKVWGLNKHHWNKTGCIFVSYWCVSSFPSFPGFCEDDQATDNMNPHILLVHPDFAHKPAAPKKQTVSHVPCEMPVAPKVYLDSRNLTLEIRGGRSGTSGGERL